MQVSPGIAGSLHASDAFRGDFESTLQGLDEARIGARIWQRDVTVWRDDPTEIEYYMCGPPPMIAAVNKMLYDLGVEKDMIAYDEF